MKISLVNFKTRNIYNYLICCYDFFEKRDYLDGFVFTAKRLKNCRFPKSSMKKFFVKNVFETYFLYSFAEFH